MIEAKHTSRPTLRIAGSGGLSDKQWDACMDWSKAGAIVLILWRFEEQVRVITPAQAMATTMAKGRKSLEWRDAYPLKPGAGFLLYDPLGWAKALL